MSSLRTKSRVAGALASLSVMGFLIAPSAFGAENAWVGTWKLDMAKSNFAGDTMTVTQSSDGKYRIADSDASYEFAVDGKDYASWQDRTTAWTAVSDRAWDSVTKAKGTVLVKSHRELSASDKTMTITYTGTRADGSAFNDTDVYTRLSGTTGLVGKWRSTKASANSPNVFVISASSSGIWRWEAPEDKASCEGKLDGSDLPVTGPTMPPGMTFGGKLASPDKIKYTIKYNGKASATGVQTLAADGHSYTDVSWAPGLEAEKQTAVYVKK